MFRWTLFLVVAAALAAPPATADQREPTPKELWDAYPLSPDESTPAPTPGSDVPAPAVPPRAEPGQDDGGGLPWFVPIMLAAPLVVVAAILLRERRPRYLTTERTEPAKTKPAAFDWRRYPPPARPAPPAPSTLEGGEQ